LQHTTYKVRDSSGKFRILTQFDRAPLAVVASPPQPGLFPFSKFSSAAFLCNAVAQDKYNRLLPRELEKRRLFVVPNARVWKLGKQGAQVTEVFFDLNGKTTPTSVRLGSTGTVILANGTIEATRIALLDLELKNKTGIPKAENLMAHLRSNFAAKLPRTALKVFDSAFPDKPPAGEQELAAFIVRGDDQTRDRRFHFQIIVGSINPKDPNPPGENADDLVPQGPEDLMWQMVPDIELVDELMNGRDDNVIVVVRGVGEIGGVNTKIGKGTSRVEISSDAGTGDPRSIKNAKITMELNSEDLLLWKEMDLAAVELLRQIAGAHPVTFTNPKVFTSFPQTKQMIEQQSTENAPWRDPLGTTHHDAGTLFMGPPDKAVTDHTGKFHHMDNVFVAGPALFPSVGSANPVLTSLCLAHRTAEFIIRERFLRGDLFSQIVAFNRPDLAKQLQTSTLSEHFATLQGAGIPSALSMEAANIAKRLDEAEALEEANP
jgi:hypothetical protein